MDNHDVDEDRVTISVQGGDWPSGSWVGISERNVGDAPAEASPYVAFM